MHIRTLSPDDAVSFQAIRLRGLQECPEAFASSYEEESATSVGELQARLGAKTDSAVLGAFEGGELLALAGIQRESMTKLAHKASIWGVYVVPEARRRSVGRQLLTHALNYAVTTLKVRQVNLGVNTKNEAAVALYRKLGFVEYGLERGFLMVGRVMFDEYQMVFHAHSAA